MSGPGTQTDFDITEQLARLRHQMEETDKFRAETRKLVAESDKFVAEQRKLIAEAQKLDRDRRYAPIILASAATGAITAVLVAVINLLTRLPG